MIFGERRRVQMTLEEPLEATKIHVPGEFDTTMPAVWIEWRSAVTAAREERYT
jgi:hypothetical protein